MGATTMVDSDISSAPTDTGSEGRWGEHSGSQEHRDAIHEPTSAPP